LVKPGVEPNSMEGPLARFGGAAVHYGDGLRRHRKYRRYTMVSPGTYAGNLMLARGVVPVAGCIVECGTWKGGHAKVDNGAGASHDSAPRAQSFA
jgi:hypothetical protein